MQQENPKEQDQRIDEDTDRSSVACPVCGSALVAEKCKLICRSATCVYRIIFNCAEF